MKYADGPGRQVHAGTEAEANRWGPAGEVGNDQDNNGTPVGRVKASSGAAEYSFITRDTDRISIGEFVYYLIRDGSGSDRTVLGRVTDRKVIREYPENYLSLVDVPPRRILAITGVDTFIPLYLVDVTIIGYRDRVFGFVNPRLPPHQGTMIYLASDTHLRTVLGGGGRGEGSALIGHLLNRSGERVPVSLDVDKVVSKHLAVLAATGSGKSYCVGVLLEELMSRYNRAAVLVLDPHGEYHTLREMRNLAGSGNPLVDGSYIPEVQILAEDDIKVRYADLEPADWSGILKDASDKMLNLLHEALRRLKRAGGGTPYGFPDIITELETARLRNEQDAMSIDGLLWRLRAYARKRIFSRSEYTPLREILRPGLLTVIDMSELEEGHQQLIASLLLRKILQARIRTKKERITEGEHYLPYPVFVVLEESHRFAPASGESRAKHVLKTILSEGRKFGVGACLVSQRPGKLDSDVLSQCMTQIIMKIINPTDQDNIKRSVEAVTADLLTELPSLTTGQAVVVGAAVTTPMTVRIRERYTRPGGSSGNAPDEWRQYRQMEHGRHMREEEPVRRPRDRELF